MIATLEFNMPEEQHEYKLATSGGALASFAYELTNWIRSEVKYGEKTTISYEDLQKKVYELLKYSGVPEEILYG